MPTLTSPSASDLLVDIRRGLNQPSATNSFWDDEELLGYANEGVRRFFVEVVIHAEGEFVTSTDLDIAADTETVALPSDFFKVKVLYRKVSGGYQALPYRNNLTEGYSTQGNSGGDLYLPYYYLRGNNLVLRPIPNFSETAGLKIEYVQFPTTMLDGGDDLTSQIAPIFRDLIVEYAIYKAKKRESLVTGVNTYAAARENLNDLFTAFKEVISQRSQSPTAVIPFNPEE